MSGHAHLTFTKFMKGAYIIVEGKREVDCFYIIREGRVRLSREVQIVAEEQGDILGPGDFFGVISTMSEHTQIETAQALTDVLLISVHRDQFSLLIQNTAPVAMKIILQFSKRMRNLNEALTLLTLKKNVDVDANHLFTVGEYYAKQNLYNNSFYALSQYLKYCPQGENIPKARTYLAKLKPFIKAPMPKHNPNDLTRNYPKESMIFSEGEPGEEIYIIKSGSVKIAKIAGHGEVLLAVLKAGDIFGEMALLESKPRAACAVAYEDCQLVMINRENFGEMIKTQPQLITRLTTLLAERIWLIYRQLANTRMHDPLGRVYDMLLIQLEKKRVNFNIKMPFFFDFGTKELINMVGLSQGDGNAVIQKLMQNKSMQIVNNKLSVSDIIEISRQTTTFKKMQEIEEHSRVR